jgi:hypothetical protein
VDGWVAGYLHFTAVCEHEELNAFVEVSGPITFHSL